MSVYIFRRIQQSMKDPSTLAQQQARRGVPSVPVDFKSTYIYILYFAASSTRIYIALLLGTRVNIAAHRITQHCCLGSRLHTFHYSLDLVLPSVDCTADPGARKCSSRQVLVGAPRNRENFLGIVFVRRGDQDTSEGARHDGGKENKARWCVPLLNYTPFRCCVCCASKDTKPHIVAPAGKVTLFDF